MHRKITVACKCVTITPEGEIFVGKKKVEIKNKWCFFEEKRIEISHVIEFLSKIPIDLAAFFIEKMSGEKTAMQIKNEICGGLMELPEESLAKFMCLLRSPSKSVNDDIISTGETKWGWLKKI